MKIALISSDAHVIEPPDLWRHRIDRRYRARAPRLQRIAGGDRWLADGRYRMGNLGNAGAAGQRFEAGQIGIRGRFSDIRPGAWEPSARLADMDLDGVWAEVLYPTATLHAFRIPDPDLVAAICRAYNDWLVELCQAEPGRLLGAALVPLDDIEAAIGEARRCRRAGLVAAAIPSRPAHGGYDDPRYQRFWAALVELNMPLSLHVGSQRQLDLAMALEHATHDVASLVTRDTEIRHTLYELIMGGVLERHPGLQVVALEYEASWAPHFLFRLDDMYRNRAQGHMGRRFASGTLPSDFFRRQVSLSFQEDPHLAACLQALANTQLIWGSDFPHAESTWPRSRQILASLLQALDPATQYALTAGNTARLYGIDSAQKNRVL